MVSAAQHLESILGLISPLGTQRLPVASALRRASARELRARAPLPRFDNSSLDGYAVRHADIGWDDLPCRLVVSNDIAAGAGQQPPLEAGTVARIMTGARIPVGADSIVPVEFTDGGAHHVVVHDAVEPGNGIRPAGDDVSPGDRIIGPGAMLTPARLGLLASCGVVEVEVHRHPRVCIVATGAELVPPGRPLGWSDIHDSNTVTLAAALSEAADTRTLSCRSDDPDEFAAILSDAAADSDLVVTTGGVSAGAYEVVKEHLGTVGGFTFRTVAIQPGRPQGFGLLAGVPVLCFPGNPVSSYVSAVLFALPAIRRMAGFPDVQPPRPTAVLTSPVKRGGVTQYRRARYDSSQGSVNVLGGPGSHLMGALADANCLAVITEGNDEAPTGERVDVIHPIP